MKKLHSVFLHEELHYFLSRSLTNLHPVKVIDRTPPFLLHFGTSNHLNSPMPLCQLYCLAHAQSLSLYTIYFLFLTYFSVNSAFSQTPPPLGPQRGELAGLSCTQIYCFLSELNTINWELYNVYIVFQILIKTQLGTYLKYIFYRIYYYIRFVKNWDFSSWEIQNTEI